MKLVIKIIILFFLPKILLASPDYFKEGLNLYEKKQYEKAKFKFEQDIVYNPKNEKSYLYLSKIYNLKDKKILKKKI